MRILVFSYVRLFGEAISAFLARLDDISETKTCHLPNCLVQEVFAFIPDVLLIDVTDHSALAEARAVHESAPDTLIVGIAVTEMAEAIIACADNGLCSYVPRCASLAELKAALDLAYKGECRCHPKIAASLLQELRRRRGSAPGIVVRRTLTRRESEILLLVGHGWCNKEIARDLNLSVATVKNHLHSIFEKLKTSGRHETLALLRSEPWLIRSA